MKLPFLFLKGFAGGKGKTDPLWCSIMSQSF